MRHKRWMMLVAALFPALSALAKDLPSQYTLGKYVPSSAWLYVHAVHNPEIDWIEERWFAIGKEFVDSGIVRDVFQVVVSLIPEPQRAGFRDGVDKVLNPLKAVRWGDLVRHEFVYAERFVPGGLGVEYIALARGARDSVDHNYQKLGDLLRAISDLAAGAPGLSLKVVEGESNGVRTMSLLASGPDGVDPTTLLVLAKRDDVVGMILALSGAPGTKGGVAVDSIPFLAGPSAKSGVSDSPRFRDALDHLPSVGETVMFFDTKRFLSTMGSHFNEISARAGRFGGKDAEGLGMMSALVTRANLFDYTIKTETTRGDRKTAESVTRTLESKRSDPLLQAFRNRKPFEAYDRFVPVDATSFSCAAGFDAGALYDELMDLIRATFPGGEAIVEKVKSGFLAAGFDPHRDVFSWLGGEVISVSVPADVVKPMGGDDWVVMVRVKDAAAAQCKVNAVIDFIAAAAQQKGQVLNVSPSSCGEGIRQLTLPMLAMFLRPVVGVKDQWLVVGSSPKAVERCFAVSEGKAKSIAESERFKREGLIPSGPVYSVNFTDISRQGQEFGQMAAAVGMMGGMAVAGMPPEVPAEVRQAAQSLLAIVSKLAPILAKIDFYSSTASVTSFEGEDGYRTITVTNYRPSKSAATVADNKEPAK